MRAYSTISGTTGSYTLSFPCGDLPVDAAVTAADHEPNGYFWEGVAELVAPDLVAEVQLDSEGSSFVAHGDLAPLQRLQQLIEPYLGDADRVRQLIEDATERGFEFDD